MSSVIRTKSKFILACLLCLFLVLFPFISQALNINQVPNPRLTNGTWVSDMASILNDETENTINKAIDELEAKNGAEIAVVTVSETKPAASPKKFTTKLFNTWKIGKEGKDNGVLFLVSVADRRVEIETGYGIENILTEKKLENIIQNTIPHFKKQDFDTGVLLGTIDIVRILEQENFSSTNIFRRNTIYQKNFSFKFDTFLLILGLVGGIHYYRVFLQKIKPIYIEPEGYSRNKAISLIRNNWQSYILIYLCTVFITTFAIAPILATISQELLFAVLLLLHLYWLYRIKQKPPSIANLLFFIFAPALFFITCILMMSRTVIGVVLIIIIGYAKDRERNNNKQLSKSFWFSQIFSCSLLTLVGFLMIKSFKNPDEKAIIFLGLGSSIAISYLVWEYCRNKFEIYGTAKVYCSCCQQSLNQIKDSLLHKYLNPPQKIAQKLGNVNYQAWQCLNCNREDEFKAYIYANIVNFIGGKNKECPTCQELTVTRKTEILKPATKWRKGVRLHKYSCQCCDYFREEQQIIPRKSSGNRNRSSNSASDYSSYSDYSSGSSYSGGDSGGSDFGGGESDGGGAGGDW